MIFEMNNGVDRIWIQYKKCVFFSNAGDEGTDTSSKKIFNKSSDSKILFGGNAGPFYQNGLKGSIKSSDSKILIGGKTFFQLDEGGEETQVGVDRASALHL